MRIDLSDLDRLTSFAGALERLFWCLMAVSFLTAVLGSAGTGLFVLILGATAFVVRAGLEDFVRSRGEEPAAPEATAKPKRATAVSRESAAPKPAAVQKKKTAVAKTTAAAKPTAEPEFTVYRTSRRLRRSPRKPAARHAVGVEAEEV